MDIFFLLKTRFESSKVDLKKFATFAWDLLSTSSDTQQEAYIQTETSDYLNTQF